MIISFPDPDVTAGPQRAQGGYHRQMPSDAMLRLHQILGDDGVTTLERELSSGRASLESLKRQFSSMEYGGGSSRGA